MPRRKPKRDTVEREIVDSLRAIGATVAQLDAANVPDLLVGFRGENFLIEVKTGKYSKLQPGQSDWHQSWRGQVATVKTVEQALAILFSSGDTC